MGETKTNLDPDGVGYVHVLIRELGHPGWGLHVREGAVEGLKVGRLCTDGRLPGQWHGPVTEQSDELSSEAGQPVEKINIL